MLFSFLVCASLIYVSHLHSRIMLRKDMECHQWYNPKRNQVSWKKKEKGFAREGLGEKEKRSYLPNTFSTSLRNHLPTFFIQISLAFSHSIELHLSLVRHVHLECHVQFWSFQCKGSINVLEAVQWRATMGLEHRIWGSLFNLAKRKLWADLRVRSA